MTGGKLVLNMLKNRRSNILDMSLNKLSMHSGFVIRTRTILTNKFLFTCGISQE